MRLFLILIFLATNAHAEGTPSATGRLETRTGSCSGALIAPDIVVTAAHCVDEGDTGNLIFRPNSNVRRIFPTTQAVRHPLYNNDGPWRFRFDFALVQLIRPVSSDLATPFALGPEAELDERLFLLSWRRNEEPRQRRCPVIPGIRGLVTLACDVRGGESGAPVLRKTDTGLELVAIISSRGTQIRQPVAQASNLRNRLTPMLDRLKETAEGS